MAEPPLLSGAVQVTVADVLLAVTDAVPIVGASGAPGSGVESGVMVLDEDEAVPVPALLYAETVKV